MPVLRNPRQEQLAQLIAMGKSATEAMQAVGYSDPRNSTRLTKKYEIRCRIVELQTRGADRALVTVASLVDEFDEARNIALERGQASAAVAATMGKARVTGKLVERLEVGASGEFDSMTASELQAFVIAGMAELVAQDPVFRKMLVEELKPVMHLIARPIGRGEQPTKAMQPDAILLASRTSSAN